MGMSASQARLLTLTARMSDLEYSAQKISNNKLRLAVQTEDVSRKYSDALNKEKLSVLTGYNNTTSTYSDLSYENLCGQDSPLMDQYGLSTNNGKLLIPKTIAAGYKDELGNPVSKNDFLVNMGEASVQYPDGYTLADYKAAQAKVNVSKPAYEAAIKDTSVKLKELNDYGQEHVDGYENAGTWSRSFANVVTSTTSTSNSLPATTYSSISSLWNTSLKNQLTPAALNTWVASTSTYPIQNYFNALIGSSMTADGGVLKTLKDSLVAATPGSTEYAKLNEICTATQLVANAIRGYESNGNGSYALNTITDTKANNLFYGTQGTNATALNSDTCIRSYMDKLASFYSNTSSVSTTEPITTEIGQIEINGTPTPSASGLRTTTVNVVKTFGGTYDETVSPEKIQYMVPTAEMSKGVAGGVASGLTPAQAQAKVEADVEAKYQKLLSDYKTALQTEASDKSAYDADAKLLEDATPYYTLDGANVEYYTNIYNRIGAGVKGEDDYATVENEDSTMNSNEWLQNQMMNGNLRLEKVDSSLVWEKISYKSDTSITQDSNDRDLAKAEAEYGIATAEIETKDKRFDLQLRQIETEHTAVQTEVDSVKKVIDKNIDRTFKMFNA